MKNSIAASMALAAAALVLFAQPARAEVVHDVSTAGALQNALLVARSNNDDDVIHLAAGTYLTADNGGNPFRYIALNTESHSLTIVGAGPGATILDGGLSDQVMSLDTMSVVGDSSASISIRGLTFANAKHSGSGAGLLVHTKDADISVVESVFSHNVASMGGGGAFPFLDGSGGSAFFAVEGSGNVLLSDCVADGNEAASVMGGIGAVNVNGDTMVLRSVFRNNHAAGGAGSGFLLFGGSLVLANNVFAENISLIGGGGGSFIQAAGVVDVVNNTFFNNFGFEGGGVSLEGEAAVNLFNNIFDDNTAGNGTSGDIFIDDSSSQPIRLFNNLLSQFCLKSGSCDVADLGGNQGGQLIGADPLLVDAANGDFHLQPGSPAIDTGSAAAPSLPETDFEGDARVQGAAPDMGVDETEGTADGTTGGGTGGASDTGGGCSLAR